MTINELNERISAEFAAIQTIENQASEESRDLNEQEIVSVEKHTETADGLIDERDELDRRVKARARQDELRKRFEGTAPKARVEHVRESVLDDPKRGFASLGEFAGSVFMAEKGGAFIDERLIMGAAATGMSQGVGADGGFLVPAEFSQSIWDGLNTGADSLLARTDNYTVAGESLSFPANAETSRANGSRYGGVRGYWMAEADQMTASQPKVRQMKLEPQELAVLVYGTDKLLKHAAAADRYIRMASSDEIQFCVGDAIVNGDGVGKPLGILASGCKVEVAKSSSQAAATFNQINVADMWARLHARNRSDAVWLINQDVEPQLSLMNTEVTNVAGTENVGGYNAKLYNADANTLMGRPVVPVEYCQTLGTAGDVILWSPSGYATGTRGGVDSAMSIHLRFDYNETAFRFIFEVDGQTWLQSALTPFKGSNTLTSVVTVAVRA